MKKLTYIRVGTCYYKNVAMPTIAGNFNEQLVWNIETLRHDYRKDFISRIKKFDGFTCIPSHTNFKKRLETV